MTNALIALPTKVLFHPDDSVQIEVRNLPGSATLSLRRLGELIAEHEVTTDGIVDLGRLDEGGYGISVAAGETVARTALDVRADHRARLRYGFVAAYPNEKAIKPVLDWARRLHLNGIQFYDWGYRHADLLGGGEEYVEAFDQHVSLPTVRNLVNGYRSIGAESIGYAAVYAVGTDAWHRWGHLALQTATGTPYGLTERLNLIDPAADEWLSHFGGDLTSSTDQVGFDGFHLDQYGYPRRAIRADGATVDVAESFQTMIAALRTRLPESRLVFNNVNDFPTWATGPTEQDVVYIEMWEPHDTLETLAAVTTRARSVAGGKPVVIAAYQHVFDDFDAAASELATSFTMATLYSHGATQLLAGEAGAVLVDPYYVRNHQLQPSTLALLTRWYDFLVEHDELLMATNTIDVTGAWIGKINDALDVTYENVHVRETPTPGTVWRRVVDVDGQLVVHLINLTGQTDTLWDAPRATPHPTGPARLRIRRVGEGLPRVRYADPDRTGSLTDAQVELDATDPDFAVAFLPEPHVWQMVLVDL